MSDFKSKLSAEANRRRRGWILRILNYFQDEVSKHLNDKVLLSGLEGNGHGVTLATLHADLQYLEEKGYCRIEEPSETMMGVRSASITAKGIDLHEGSIEDKGIEF